MSEEVNPYESPRAGDQATLLPRAKRFLPGRSRAFAALMLLTLVMVVRVLSAGTAYLQIAMLDRARAGMQITPVEVASNIARQSVVNSVKGVILLLSAVTFIAWLYRANSNLRALGNTRPEYTPGWTIGGWFIPIANCFIPYWVMAEVWNGSHPANFRSQYTVRAPGLSLVRWWWGLWLALNFIGYGASLVFPAVSQSSITPMIAMTWMVVVVELAWLPAAFVAMALVQRVTVNQQRRYALFQEAKANEPIPTADELFPFLPTSVADEPDGPAEDFQAPWLDNDKEASE